MMKKTNYYSSPGRGMTKVQFELFVNGNGGMLILFWALFFSALQNILAIIIYMLVLISSPFDR